MLRVVLPVRPACAAVVAAGLVCAACSGSPTAPSLPEPTINPTFPAPAPGAALVVLKGRVNESAPTTIAHVGAARITVIDGPNAGKVAVADSLGFYSIPDLQPGAFTVSVAANGYQTAVHRLDVPADITQNFNLMPSPRIMVYTLRGDVRDTDVADGTCSDGTSDRACRIVLVPIHNAGTIDASLEWTVEGGGAADLDLTLFQTNNPTPIARSDATGAGPERLAAKVAGASTYELRITWASGAGAAQYTITIQCPN